MKKMQITNKKFAMTAAIGSFVITALLIVGTLWVSGKTNSATNEAVSAVSSFYLDAMADRRAKTIINLIDNNFEHMEKALTLFEDEGIETQEHFRAMIGKIKQLLSLNRFALVDKDNVVYTQYTTYTGGSRHEFLSEDNMQGRVISTVYLYGSSKELCLAIPTNDLVIMGIPFKACFVQIDIQDIVNLLAFDDNGKTSFGLYSPNGGNLSNTELGNVISTKNIFEATKDILPKESWEKFRNDFENEAQGSVTIDLDGAVETLSYVPVPGTGWHMVVLIRESVINEQIRTISEKNLSLNRYMITIALVAMLIFSAILLLQLRSISAEKLEAEKENSRYLQMMANFDSMTGVRNKHAYTEIENALNEQIHNKELDKLAVVVCDVNGLKYVNDTLGHEAGDKLIKDASAMICEHFNHGSVFRVGGDEFVVLLQGRGYELLDESTREFNKAAEDHIKSNEVVVSIGYSKLESGDEQLSDVFGRADQMMYERKKELKGMGAKTRE